MGSVALTRRDAAFAMTPVWVSNVVVRPPAKRAAAVGIVSGIGNLGNLCVPILVQTTDSDVCRMGSYTWKADWGPEYHQSMAISLAALVFSTVLSVGIRQSLVRENQRLDKEDTLKIDTNRVEEAGRLEGISCEQAMERRKGFRYLY